MDRTSYLFSQPSLIEGIGRLFDWGATLNIYNSSDSAQEADYKALRSDWKATGDDIREAIVQYEKGQE